MKICLPVEQPPITSFPTIANTLSILWGHKEKVLPWLSDRLIQLVVRPNYDLVNTDFYDHADIDNYDLLFFVKMFSLFSPSKFPVFTEGISLY